MLFQRYAEFSPVIAYASAYERAVCRRAHFYGGMAQRLECPVVHHFSLDDTTVLRVRIDTKERECKSK